jgi:hypothetical protein
MKVMRIFFKGGYVLVDAVEAGWHEIEVRSV